MKAAPLRTQLGRRRGRPVLNRPARRRFRPGLEVLESHILLSTFAVTTLNDNGDNCDPIPGSLRWAIIAANADPLSDAYAMIVFDIPPLGQNDTIYVPPCLPPVTRQFVQFWGTLSNGAYTLDGSREGPSPWLLRFEGVGDAIYGPLTITNSPGTGISLAGTGELVEGAKIIDSSGDGVDVGGFGDILRGDQIQNNGQEGVDITNSSASVHGNVIAGNHWDGVDIAGNDNVIGLLEPGVGLSFAGNQISGNGNYGVQIQSGGRGNSVVNNFIGTDIWGEAALPNGWSGVSIDNSPDNIIGGTEAYAGNLISANGNDGISIIGAGSIDDVVQGNKIGTDLSGTAALGNAGSGIFVGQTDDTGSATGALIGGNIPAAQNVVSANGNYGIWISGPAVTDVVVESNYVGTDITGEVAIGNAWGGLSLDQGASTCTIEENLVSGNATADGISISGPGTSGNLVVGNLIGTDASGTLPLGNGEIGVSLQEGTSNNTIGGTNASARNIISANSWSGVGIGAGTSGNVVVGNYIGLDIRGTLPLGNSNSGIYIDGASGNVIGGTVPGAGNSIASNLWDGISIYASSDNLVEGNQIGTDVTGLKPLGNHNSGVGIWAPPRETR